LIGSIANNHCDTIGQSPVPTNKGKGMSREAFCLRMLHKKYFNVSNRWCAPTLRVSKMATNLSVMEVVFFFFPFVT